MNIKIFDSLTHPTLNGKWLSSDHDSSFKKLSEELNSHNLLGAIACGLNNIGDFEVNRYISAAKNYPNIYAVAPMPDISLTEIEIEKKIVAIKNLGYIGIKIHPRFSNIDLIRDIHKLNFACAIAAKLDLTIFICSYYACHAHNFPNHDILIPISKIIEKNPTGRFVLLHGGGVRLLEFSEFVRFNPNVLLDLSLTIMKYELSSIDQDIQYLFSKFDKRICIGSDHPEWDYINFKKRISHFCEKISQEKIDNITNKNIMKFLKIID